MRFDASIACLSPSVIASKMAASLASRGMASRFAAATGSAEISTGSRYQSASKRSTFGMPGPQELQKLPGLARVAQAEAVPSSPWASQPTSSSDAFGRKCRTVKVRVTDFGPPTSRAAKSSRLWPPAGIRILQLPTSHPPGKS